MEGDSQYHNQVHLGKQEETEHIGKSSNTESAEQHTGNFSSSGWATLVSQNPNYKFFYFSPKDND